MEIYEPTSDAKTLIMESLLRKDLENVKVIFNFGMSKVLIRLTTETFRQILIGDKML